MINPYKCYRLPNAIHERLNSNSISDEQVKELQSILRQNLELAQNNVAKWVIRTLLLWLLSMGLYYDWFKNFQILATELNNGDLILAATPLLAVLAAYFCFSSIALFFSSCVFILIKDRKSRASFICPFLIKMAAVFQFAQIKSVEKRI